MRLNPSSPLSAFASWATLLLPWPPTTPVIGLVTKTETNPFFVKMKEGAHGRSQEAGRQAASPAPARPTATTRARSRPWKT